MAAPRSSVIPVGWSWALWGCQQIHKQAVLRAGLLRRPDVAQYVDNFISADTDPMQVSEAVRGVVFELRRMGLEVHEVEEGVSG